MKFYKLQIFVFAYLCKAILALRSEFQDVSPLPTVFETTSLPLDQDGRLMSTLGNGHVATTVYSDTVYMNGLYNGQGEKSHRARVPSGNNIRVHVPPEAGPILKHTFSLDVGKGVFYERIVLPGEIFIEQRTFAHRYYTRQIVTQIEVTNNSTSSLTLKLSNTPGKRSADLTPPFSGSFDDAAAVTYWDANTRIKENKHYQPGTLPVFIIAMVAPDTVVFPANGTSTQTYATSYDFVQQNVDFFAVIAMSAANQHQKILDQHIAAWEAVWNHGSIQVDGNIQLAKLVNAGLYYVLSCLPVFTRTLSDSSYQFYGLSPGSLAYGSLNQDYQGHTLWDSEIWMYPQFLYFYPETAKHVLSYRLAVAQAAMDRAKALGYKGALFPRQSARTGVDVTPNATSSLPVHINSDISYAIRQYIAVTRDLKWLTDQYGETTSAYNVVRAIAEFWTSKATYNHTTENYDIRDVLPPDEDHPGVDNNGYTNIGAGYSIYFAKYAECLSKSTGYPNVEDVPDQWLEIAKGLKLLYDEKLDYHPEFEGYQAGTPIKHADAVLMGFPLLYDMSQSTRRNDLLIYGNATRSNGPAMTWPMHTIGFLELDDLVNAELMFNLSYQNYLKEPFKVWTETKDSGAVNFITGMGGFLQSVISGYAGIRVYPEKVVISKPRVLPNSSGLIINGFKYLENVININITKSSITLTLVEPISKKYPLQVSKNNGHEIDLVGSLVFSTVAEPVRLEITTKTPTKCAVPLDKIGMKVGPPPLCSKSATSGVHVC